jgi:DNA-directed RNA polymerase specialized sigma24 family protein
MSSHDLTHAIYADNAAYADNLGDFDRLVYLLTIDPSLSASVFTEEERLNNPIFSLDFTARVAFVLHHVLGCDIGEAAGLAEMDEEEFRSHLKYSYVQLAGSCQFFDSDALAAPALA